MNLAYPTLPNARQAQNFGNLNPQMYPGKGRHMGVDIAAHVGTPIYAVCPGIVDEVSLTGAYGYGRYIIIEHGDFKTLYAHQHKVLVMPGQTVEAGQQIGEMGGDPTDSDPIDGASTGPHLHFEVILPTQPNTDYVKTILGWTVDPFPYLLGRFAAPALWSGTVIERTGVRVRSSADSSTSKNILDALSMGIRVEFFGLEPINSKGEVWGQIRSMRKEWTCVEYQNKKYFDVKPVSTQTQSTDDEAISLVDENAIRRDEVQRMIAFLDARLKGLA